MLYLIGLGLNEKGISKEALEIIPRCKKIYLDSYTVDFPYTEQALVDEIGKKVTPADREKIENMSIIDDQICEKGHFIHPKSFQAIVADMPVLSDDLA